MLPRPRRRGALPPTLARPRVAPPSIREVVPRDPPVAAPLGGPVRGRGSRTPGRSWRHDDGSRASSPLEVVEAQLALELLVSRTPLASAPPRGRRPVLIVGSGGRFERAYLIVPSLLPTPPAASRRRPQRSRIGLRDGTPLIYPVDRPNPHRRELGLRVPFVPRSSRSASVPTSRPGADRHRLGPSSARWARGCGPRPSGRAAPTGAAPSAPSPRRSARRCTAPRARRVRPETRHTRHRRSATSARRGRSSARTYPADPARSPTSSGRPARRGHPGFVEPLGSLVHDPGRYSRSAAGSRLRARVVERGRHLAVGPLPAGPRLLATRPPPSACPVSGTRCRRRR